MEEEARSSEWTCDVAILRLQHIAEVFLISLLSLASKLVIAVVAAMVAILALGVLAIAIQDSCDVLAGDLLPYGAGLCSAFFVGSIGVLRSLLPLHFGQIWKVSKVGAMLASFLWLYALALSWATVVLTVPAGGMTVTVAAIAAAGWLLVELTAGLLPPVAAALFVAQPPPAPSGPATVPPPPPRPRFDNVASLLDHLFAHGADGLEGLRLEAGTVMCSQASLARHAGCSKTEGHRQLRQLAAEGMISVTADRSGTRIWRASISAPAVA
jgi:hypothetical protein